MGFGAGVCERVDVYTRTDDDYDYHYYHYYHYYDYDYCSYHDYDHYYDPCDEQTIARSCSVYQWFVHRDSTSYSSPSSSVTVVVEIVEIVEIVVVTEMYHMDSVYSFHQIATYSERRTT